MEGDRKNVQFQYAEPSTCFYLFCCLLKGNFIRDAKLSTSEAHAGSWQPVYFSYNGEIFLNIAEGTVQWPCLGSALHFQKIRKVFLPLEGEY